MANKPLPKKTSKKLPSKASAIPQPPEQDVGYCKPPLHSRFKKGQSGNPGGRRKGSRNIATILHEALIDALMTRVTVTDNGKKRSITLLDANLKQVVNRGASGDLSANKLVFQAIPMLLRALDTESLPFIDPEADRAVLRQLGQRFMAAAKASGNGGEESK